VRLVNTSLRCARSSSSRLSWQGQPAER
jgi:hypothetical protein